MIDADFNEAVTDAGGELDAATSGNPAQGEVLQYARSTLGAMGYSDIYCGLIRNRQFNACAFRSKNRDFIALNSGAVRALMFSSFALLSHPKVFPDIGSSKDEPGDVQFSGGFRDLTVSFQPRSPERLFFAKALLQFASTFIFCHEFGHHWTGHIDFVSQGNHRAAWDEASGGARTSVFEPITRQAIELDADRAAVSLHVCSLIDLMEKFPVRLQAFRAWFASMFLVYYLMAEATGSLESCAGSTHPHPSVRLMFIIPHACHEISQRIPPAAKNIERVALSSLHDLHNAWNAAEVPGYATVMLKSISRDTEDALFGLHRELATLHERGISRCVYPAPNPEDLRLRR